MIEEMSKEVEVALALRGWLYISAKSVEYATRGDMYMARRFRPQTKEIELQINDESNEWIKDRHYNLLDILKGQPKISLDVEGKIEIGKIQAKQVGRNKYNFWIK